MPTTTAAAAPATTAIIDLVETTGDRRAFYGITHTSASVFQVRGAGLHNRHYPHRVVIWDNTVRPVGGKWHVQPHLRNLPGAYIDPSGRPTDNPTTIVLDAECIAIDAYGTGTGTPRSGQVYSDVVLITGGAVQLRYPDGTVSGPYTIATRSCADPVLIPVEQG